MSNEGRGRGGGKNHRNERRLEKWTISFTSHFLHYSEEDAVWYLY